MSDEVYPRAPVQFVTFEVQYPMTPAFAKPEGKEVVYDQLAEQFPLLEALNSVQIQFGVGDAAPPMPIPQPGSEIRMTNRHRTTSVTVGPAIVRIEQAAHTQFSDLRDLITEVLEAVESAARIHGIQRATLRYIDEIQHPDGTSPAAWKGLVHEGLVGPVDLLEDMQPVVTEGSILFQPDPQHLVRVAYGAHPAGTFAVDPNGPLRIRPRSPGAFFRLDTESTWVAPPDEVPPLIVADVVELADRLHEPVSAVFEATLTPQLRDFIRTPA